MSRLTEKKRNFDGTAVSKESLVREYGTLKGTPSNHCIAILNKLADYEDKQEQGLLISLPCKVGTTVFCIFERRTKCTEHNQEFDEYSCQGCECLECDSRKEKYVHEMKAYSLDWIITNIDNFGKTVFLTRSEAEEALARMKGE